MTTAGHEQPPGDPPNTRLQRRLKIVVAVLGLLIVAGLGAVAAQVVRLAGEPRVSQSGAGDRTLALPEGAAVRSLALGGQRLAVHYTAPDGDGIAILDIDTGRVLSRVRVTAAPPPR